MNKLGWSILPFVIFLAFGIFLWRGLSLDPHNLPSAKIGKSLPDFVLPDLSDFSKQVSSEDLKNKVVLLNVFASWCAACSEEQVFLLELAHLNVPIYGLNYKDKPQNARFWLSEWGNPYRKIAADLEGKTAIDLGVYGAPETFLIDKKGIIRYRHVGVLTAKDWKDVILPKMQQLEKTS